MINQKKQIENQLAAEFEARMMELVRDARDGAGLLVRLEPNGARNAGNLRNAVFAFLEPVDRGACFIICLEATSKEASARAEAAFWENLALLARATAAAIRFEAQPVAEAG